MNRSQLEYILAVDQYRNFGKAAEACFITQSTLSTMVAKFENQIGIKIFNRKKKPVSVTPQGEEIIKSLKSINGEYKQLDENINELKGIEFGKLSLACIPTVAPFLYPMILNKISNKYQHVNFTIHELTTEKMIEEILAGNIDIGIASTPLDNKNLLEYPLYKEEFLVYDCGKSLSNKNYKVSQIDLERLWLLEEGHCLRNQIGEICELRQQKQINGNLTYNCGTISTLIEMVKINKGITLIPKLALQKNKQVKKENIYKISNPTPVREIGLITHKNFLKHRILEYISDTIKSATYKALENQAKKSLVYKPFS